MPLSAGTRLGPYEILSPLGAGGMGEVYKAKDSKLHREVAVKVLPERLTSDKDALSRFEREARAVAALSHPNILSIHDFGTDNGIPYAVMELLEGTTLREKLLSGALPPRKAVDYATQIADGLAAAHEKGIIHRDLKPDNVFITKDGRVKILDFGLAKQSLSKELEDSHSPTVSAYTEPGAILGTVGYMSPEQVRGKPLDARSDIFSFGAVLYEMLTGQRAFRGESAAETMAAIVQKEPSEISPEEAPVSSSLDQLTRRCLEKSPEQRFQTARDLAYAVRVAGQSSGTTVTPAPEQLHRPRRWVRAIIAIAAVAIVVAGIRLWIFFGRNRGKELQSATARVLPAALSTSSTAIPAKSVAVLPFENLSRDPDNAYFADGMQDMILTKLAVIGDLKVISRTSTKKYASHPDDLKAIGQQLGVAAILEGSVQKAGNQVLINVQLIDANTDAHLWADAYQRSIDNIFGVEGEVAQKVAVALNARLTQTETERLNTAPTQSPQAYDLFLKAEYFTGRAYGSYTASDFEAVVSNYRAAVAQDPKFAVAWARMAQTESLMAWNASPVFGVNRGRLAAQAKQSVAQAEALAPDSVATQVAQGYYHLYVLTDLDGALSAFRAAIALESNNAGALYGLGTTYYHLGRFQASAEAYQKAAVLDPRNLNILSQSAHAYWEQHRYGQAEQVFRQSLAVDPASATFTSDLADVHLCAGDLAGAQAVLDAAPAAMRADFHYFRELASVMLCRRDYAGARGALQKALSQNLDDRNRWTAEERLGDVEWAAGNQPQARLHYQRAATLLETALKQPQPWAGINSDLAWVYARLGRTREALVQARLFLKSMQAAKSVEREQSGLKDLAEVQAQIGQVDQAITGLDRLLAMPAGEHISLPRLKLDPTWDPIRHDPRFQALLKKHGT